MQWVLEHLFQIAALLFVIISVVRGIRNARETSQPGGGHTTGSEETDEQRRVREIQERIRRKIAERRGGHAPEAAAPHGHAQPPPVMPRREAEFPERGEVFRGPLQRALEEIERKLQPAAPPPVMAHANRAELERQAQLAEEMRLLEQARAQAARRAAHLAADQAEAARTTTALRTATRGELLHDLRDPHSLRRAIVLREVLGPPVGLR